MELRDQVVVCSFCCTTCSLWKRAERKFSENITNIYNDSRMDLLQCATRWVPQSGICCTVRNGPNTFWTKLCQHMWWEKKELSDLRNSLQMCLAFLVHGAFEDGVYCWCSVFKKQGCCFFHWPMGGRLYGFGWSTFRPPSPFPRYTQHLGDLGSVQNNCWMASEIWTVLTGTEIANPKRKKKKRDEIKKPSWNQIVRWSKRKELQRSLFKVADEQNRALIKTRCLSWVCWC